MLGKKVTDKITGFSGIVTGRVNYISGCNQALVNPPVDKDGNIQEAAWFDEQRLNVSDDDAIVLENGNNPGFDHAPPVR